MRAIFNVEGNFYQNIDYDYCFTNGIYVLNCGEAYALAVAEMALGFAIDLGRGIAREDRNARNGNENILLSSHRAGGNTLGFYQDRRNGYYGFLILRGLPTPPLRMRITMRETVKNLISKPAK